jgi:hypothetical protein
MVQVSHEWELQLQLAFNACRQAQPGYVHSSCIIHQQFQLQAAEGVLSVMEHHQACEPWFRGGLEASTVAVGLGCLGLPEWLVYSFLCNSA